jgi:hypothetical protein
VDTVNSPLRFAQARAVVQNPGDAGRRARGRRQGRAVWRQSAGVAGLLAVSPPGWFLIRANRSRHRKLRAVLLALGDEGAGRDVRIATEYPCDQSNPNRSRSGQDRVHAQAFGSRLCSS